MDFFLLFGWRTRNVVSSQHGQFYCQACGRYCTYATVRRRQYLHLFFVPVFTLSDEDGGIECCSCRNGYDESALYHRPKGSQAGNWKCPQCSRSWPETNVRCLFCKVRPDGTPA